MPVRIGTILRYVGTTAEAYGLEMRVDRISELPYISGRQNSGSMYVGKIVKAGGDPVVWPVGGDCNLSCNFEVVSEWQKNYGEEDD